MRSHSFRELHSHSSLILTFVGKSISRTLTGCFVASGASFLLAWISHSDTGPVDDVEAAHVEPVPLGKVHQILPNTIHFSLERPVGKLLIDDAVIGDDSMLVEVVDDVAIGGVEVDSLDADRDLLPPGGPDEAGLNVIVDLDDVVFTEAIQINPRIHPNFQMERSAWIDLISLNLRLNVDAKLSEQFAHVARVDVVVGFGTV